MKTELHVIGPLGLFRKMLERSGIVFTEYPAFSDTEECPIPDITKCPLTDFRAFLDASEDLASRYQGMMKPQPRNDGRFLATVYSSIHLAGKLFPDFGSREQALELLTSAQGKACFMSGCFIVIPAEDAPIPTFNPFHLSTCVRVRQFSNDDERHMMNGPLKRSLIDDVLDYAERVEVGQHPIRSLTPTFKEMLRDAGFPLCN